ncbi:uncharacterized protein [Cicer arietinum]|uniref:uncharacterized protein isoform X2 n=1 Tax=Cicer arietinum TaxID=3827 RepID=UPI003CC5E5DE
MEECNNNNKGEVQPSSRSIPQQQYYSSFIPRRENKGSINASSSLFSWFGNNRLVLWLLLITLWAYLVFFVQSKWDHYDKEQEISSRFDFHHNNHDLVVKNSSLFVDTKIDGVLSKKQENGSKKRSRRSLRSKHKRKIKVENFAIEKNEIEFEIPLVGPFGSIEDKILKLGSNENICGVCNKKGEFAKVVKSKSFVLIFHELSMTGAPLSMMELASELLRCGANVSAVVLSKKGGLMEELIRREIKVVDDKVDHSFKSGMIADLVIAGSAVCASWIEQYIEHFPSGASQVIWWIMENRREYFDRSKHVLNRVKMLVFLSESQSKQWRKWCEEESIRLIFHPAIVPLSVNDELAFAAGMDVKRKVLRESIRREIGLNDNDMLVISLSSINPAKGQLLFLESASSLVENETFPKDEKMKKSLEDGKNEHVSTLIRRHHIRKLLPMLKDGSVDFNNVSSNSISSNRKKVLLTNNNGKMKQSLKILIGSVRSKSNKVEYVKSLVSFLSQHSNLSKSVLWTPATTHVASIYSAADVYVINSQGLGETFGRVTIEAMAFGLPVALQLFFIWRGGVGSKALYLIEKLWCLEQMLEEQRKLWNIM